MAQIISKTHCSVQNLGMGAQTAENWVRRAVRNGGGHAIDWLAIKEISQLDAGLWADVACMSLNDEARYLLLGDFRQLPAVLDSFAGAPVKLRDSDGRLSPRADGEPAQRPADLRLLAVPPRGRAGAGAPAPGPGRGPPRVPAAPGHAARHLLVISHAHRMRLNKQHNRRLAPEDALLVPYQREAEGPVTTNKPQATRLWPGLRLVGAGGRIAKGAFVTVKEVSQKKVALEGGQAFSPQTLLHAARLAHAITYASAQSLTLQGRVWLHDTGCQHFEIRHLYMGASRATSGELLTVL